MDKPVRVFVSYSHLDRRWMDRSDPHNIVPFLEASLSGRDVPFWYDLSLEPGVRFQREIEEQIDAADIALLIVSQNFLNSDFIRRYELPRIEARAEKKELLVLPILAEHCDWEDVESLRARQMLPGAPMPLIEYLGREADWSRVRFEILQALKKQVARIREGVPEAPADIKEARPGASDIVERSRTLAARVRPLPMTAFVFKKEIEPLARGAAADAELERNAAWAAATLYRLFAGAMLLEPGADIKEATRQALPWLKRALAVFPDFEDAAELGQAVAFFEGLLVPLRREVELRHVLKNEFRVVMVNVPTSELEAVTEKALAVVIDMIKQKGGQATPAAAPAPSPVSPAPIPPGPVLEPSPSAFSGEVLSADQREALKLGFVLGSRLTLVALPVPARSTPFSGSPFALGDGRRSLDILGFSAADQSLVVSRTEAAMAEANSLAAAETLLNEINRVKDALSFQGRTSLMAAYRLGVSLGYVLEFASILTRQGAQPGHVAMFEALVQKHKSTMATDLAAAALPASVADAAGRAGRAARVPGDLTAIIAACRDVLSALR